MRINDCDGVILCGGLGKRLRSVVADVPKVMAPVKGGPFLDLVIGHLKAQGIGRVVLCTGYKADLVERHYRNHRFGLTIDFSRENVPLGTGGALKNARGVIFSEPFFVLNGDSFLAADFRAFLDFHKGKKSMATMMVARTAAGKDFGCLRLDDDGRIVDFREKIDGPEKPLVNAGIYCFDQDIFRRMPERKEFSLENDLFPGLVGGRFYGYCVDNAFIDIGTPERYAVAEQHLEKGNAVGD